MIRKGFFIVFFLSARFLLNSQDLYDLYTLRTIEITFTEPKWDSLLQEYHKQKLDIRIPATLKMNGISYDSVGVQYSGNATFFLQDIYNIPKFPLNIEMDYVYPNQSLLGYTKLKLGNVCTDPTFVREALAARIYQQYIPTYRSNFIKVYINGAYMGLYSNRESINKQFLQRTYGTKKGTLFKCDPSGQAKCSGWDFNSDPNLVWYGKDSCWYYDNYEMKSNYGWKDLLKLIDTLNNKPSGIRSLLNVDRSLWHMAVSNVILNLDTYNGKYIHNYYLYKQSDGLFHMIPWDLNESFSALGLNDTVAEQWDPLYGYSPKINDRPMVFQLLSDPIYKKQYMAHVRTILNEVYDSTYMQPIIDSMQSLIYTSAATDPHHGYGMNEFYKNVHNPVFSFKYFPLGYKSGLLSGVRNRKKYMQKNTEVKKVSPVISNTNQKFIQSTPGVQVWITSQVSNASTVELMITNNIYGSFFFPVKMYDDGLHQDGAANDGIYGALIPFTTPGEKVLYYVRAQNVDAMKMDPQRAEFIFYSYVIGSVISVNEFEENEKELILFPNPSSGEISITASHQPETQTEITVRDMLGNNVYSFTPPLHESRIILNLQHLSSGVYQVQWGESFSKKLVLLK